MPEKISKDSISEGMFDCPYSQLSSWGQRQVDTAWHKFTKVHSPITAHLPTGLDSATLRRDNERLARELESARLEVLELWDEVTDLKNELSTLQAEFNPPS